MNHTPYTILQMAGFLAGQPRSERKRFASILRSGYLIQGSDGKVWMNVAQIEAQP